MADPKQKDIVALAALAMMGGNEALRNHIETEGHRELCGKSQPTKLPKQHSASCRMIMESAGVTFGEPIPDDKLFVAATLPAGWSTRRTDHYMYTDLLDDQGRKRASIMYKPDFYDRDASLSALTRWQANAVCDDYASDAPYVPAIVDSDGKVYWRGKPVETEKRFQGHEVALKIAAAKFAEAFPNLAALRAEHEKIDKSDMDYTDRSRLSEAAWAHYVTETWRTPEPTWPPSESQQMPGEIYTLHVSLYYPDGRFCDSGDNSTRRCETDAQAIERLMANARSFLGSYGKVIATIRCGDRKVHTETVAQQKTFGRSRNGKIGSDGYWHSNQPERFFRDW